VQLYRFPNCEHLNRIGNAVVCDWSASEFSYRHSQSVSRANCGVFPVCECGVVYAAYAGVGVVLRS